MWTKTCGFLGLVCALALAASASAQDDEMVANPKYKFWASHKAGTTATYQEVTKFTGGNKDTVPGGKEEKTIVYKLLNVSKEKVVVQTTVTEEEGLGLVEQAPTKHIFFAKVKKSTLSALLDEFGAKEAEEETVKVGKDEIKCKVLSGVQKKDDAVITYKLYYSDSVPGGVVKRTRFSKSGEKFGAETTISLVSFAAPKAKKEKDKKDEK
jgi:hypothetical protein